jgi:type I restriction-modification system DNA methylase subunit
MKEHQTIFSKKELKNTIANAFFAGIPNKDQKIELIKTWQKSILSGKILKAKEEEIKSQFLILFFGDILGYEFKNENKWNLQFENKSLIDSSKADAALGFFTIDDAQKVEKDIRVVVEIKDARTTLDKPQNRQDFKGSAVEQCFMYAAKSGEKCKWIIVSNFLEIRLYLSNDMTKYESFDVLSLHLPDEFSRFYYLLAKEQLFLQKLESKIDILLSNRQAKEEKITNEFYEEYRYLREVFLQHLKLHNPTINSLNLLQFAQTIIDRIIFISVVKDFGLIANNIFVILEKKGSESWADDQQELWRQLKNLFKALDKGLPSRNLQKFNGGLFRHLPALDELVIKDVFLKKLLELGKYDFESDLNINILGHIFEKSITDLENLKKEIIENDFSSQYLETEQDIEYKSPTQETNKRKKEGVFYTPEPITRYIVQQTIGTWLSEQKKAIGIFNLSEIPHNEEDKTLHIITWEKYKSILQNIKILDPACGSGAFLTQAFDFLLQEWMVVEDVLQKLKGDKQTNILGQSELNKLANRKKEIVNQNLFGVDINVESVEITKLGLWLKSASINETLTLLESNIFCGNSLISDSTISDDAFSWEDAFNSIFQKGGFDIVIGNPPYVSTKTIEDIQKKYFVSNFETAVGQFDLYGLFIEKSIKTLKENGKLGFITSNTYFSNKDFIQLRKFILDNISINELINLDESIFKDANLDVAILIGTKGVVEKNHNIKIYENPIKFYQKDPHSIAQNRFNSEKEYFEFKINIKEDDYKLINKIFENKKSLSEIVDLPRGIEIGSNSDKIIQRPTNGYEKLLVGKDISKYTIHFAGRYIQFEDDKSVFKEREIYHQPKILIQRIRNLSLKTRIVATLDLNNYLCTNTLRIAILKNEDFNLYYILAILNSSITNWIFSKYFLNKDIYAYQLERLPIPIISKNEQQFYIDAVKQLLVLKDNFELKKATFIKRMVDNFSLKSTSFLDEFFLNSFSELITEIKKQKISISFKQQDDLEIYFQSYKEELQLIYNQSNILENEIDRKVYELYQLNKEEIDLIENT